MPVNLEWDVEHTLVSPVGDVPMNQLGPILSDGTTYAYYLLRNNPYTILPPRLRSVTDDLSQADGTSLQTPYISGLEAQLHVELWVAPNGNVDMIEPACAGQMREMEVMLTAALNALRTQGATPDSTQRLFWQPTGYPDRQMLTQCLLSGWPTPVFFGDDGRGVGITFALATPFPYAVDLTLTETSISEGSTVLIPNDGNANYSPVVIVEGTTSEFAITRVDTDEVVSYVGPDTITGSAEIDFFTANIATGGTDLIADLDPTVTTFFFIPPGGCEVQATGADLIFQTRSAVV